MAAFLALLRLLRQVARRELSSFSSVGLNNLLFCTVFLMSGTGAAKHQQGFWSTLLFQLILLTPLLVSSSLDAQQRLPRVRMESWPLSEAQRFALGLVSFALNPLLLLVVVVYLVWIGVAAAAFFLLLGILLHALAYALQQWMKRWRSGRVRLTVPAWGVALRW